jgi:hypothetical protein
MPRLRRRLCGLEDKPREAAMLSKPRFGRDTAVSNNED